ncbi:hypothetical protein ACPCG0_09535 [Propionibacteriaceae bacterium Y1923]|uniref:hypothetical protein n=1 Tax=Aestuariimicrobium sp. Y1814 TaxID=3418742 RepID=UPI003C23AE42
MRWGGVVLGLPRAHLLSPADLPALPRCADCGFSPADDLEWARAAQDRWAMVGVEFAGPSGTPAYALVGLPELLPPHHPLVLPGQPAPDVAILVAVNTSSRAAVTGLAGKLVGRVQAIEAAGSRGHSSCQAPSATWLQHVGFHPSPDMEWLPGGARRMRLDLTATLVWQEPWRWAARRLGGLRARPDPAAPEGAGRVLTTRR